MELHRLIYLLLIIYVMESSWSQRRIRDGIALGKLNKKYAVYFVKSNKSTIKYNDWLCGGALVTDTFIVTAAACLEDVDYMWAITGLKELVEYKDLDVNKCTRWYMRKVLYTCVPRAYEFDYGNVQKWSAIDIGIAKVEPDRYKFDKNYCDYQPEPIPINYDPKYQREGIDAIVLGWGHTEIWKQPGDDTPLLQKGIQYGSVSIMNKNKCKEGYSDVPGLPEIIEKYMICTLSKGNLDINGNLITTIKPDSEGCTNTKDDNCRRNLQNKMNLKSMNTTDITKQIQSRRHGICQNDHGGPLVTWIGGKEYLIGVASVFRVNAESKCEGPYLYTSTQCNGAFLNCILSNGTRRGNSICDLPAKQRGFEMIHRHISWDDHPDGPAAREKNKYRTRKPLRGQHKRKIKNKVH